MVTALHQQFHSLFGALIVFLLLVMALTLDLSQSVA
jgi:hypothetical protein